jgi:hypothetical protein
VQLVRRVDKEIGKSSTAKTQEAFRFVRVVKASAYLSPTARSYILNPWVKKLAANLDQWAAETEAVEALAPYASVIPASLIPDYVSAITLTFVGYMGHSCQWSRRDFYANRAAIHIPKMVEKFDDTAAAAFVDCIRSNDTLRSRVQHPIKMGRLRALGEIVLGRVSTAFPDKKLLQALVDPAREKEFWNLAK